MMKWIITIFLFAITSQVRAVAIDNEIFSLEANEIRFKLGEITATNQVVVRIKSHQVLRLLYSDTKSERAEPISVNRPVSIPLDQGWMLQGQVHTISIEGAVAIIAAQKLSFKQAALANKKI
jgi:hypothetical protein